MIEKNIDWNKIKIIFNECTNKIMRMEALINKKTLFRDDFEHKLMEYIKKICNIKYIVVSKSKHQALYTILKCFNINENEIKKIKIIDSIKYCENESIILLDNISINLSTYKELKHKAQNLIVVSILNNFSLETLKNNKNFDISLMPFGFNNKSCLIFLKDEKYYNVIDSFLNHGSDGKDNCVRIGTNGYIDFFEIIYLYSVLKYMNNNLSIKEI